MGASHCSYVRLAGRVYMRRCPPKGWHWGVMELKRYPDEKAPINHHQPLLGAESLYIIYNTYIIIYIYIYIINTCTYYIYICILLEGVNMWPVANTSNFHDWYFHFLICGSPDSSPGMTWWSAVDKPPWNCVYLNITQLVKMNHEPPRSYVHP